MGTLFVAACPCGFTTECHLGGGFMNFMTHCAAPALCESCGAFCVLNYLEDDPRCELCGGTVRFYSDPELQEHVDSANSLDSVGYMLPPEFHELWGEAHLSAPQVFSWNAQCKRGPLVLSDVAYLCPRCWQKTLRFEETGNWD